MMNRRNFTATLGALPFLPGLLTATPQRAARSKALIMIWLDGGMSHLDTFDAKPEAAPNIRGDLPIIESSLEGVFVSQHLPKIADRMRRLSLIRSVTSPEGNHDRGSCYMLTGRRPNPVLTYPSIGALYGADGVQVSQKIPEYVAIPDAHYYARQGFLPLAHGPFELGGAPGVQGFKALDLNPNPNLSQALNLLKTVDALDGQPRSAMERARDEFMSQARYLSLNDEARAMFDISKERPEVIQQYGRHKMGASALLARRLVENGVRAVFVRDQGWDHHRDINNSLTYGFPPKLDALDQTISALFDDLDRRGMLESTLVVVASEFGRTPRINASGGRDHWSQASSVLLFGAGVRPGVCVGETDSKGEAPILDPVSPADLFYTILQALDADVESLLRSPDGRPIPRVEDSMRPVRQLLI